VQTSYQYYAAMLQRKISRGPPEFVNIINEVASLSSIKNFEHVIQFGSDDVDSFADGLYKVRLCGYRDGQKIRKSYVIKWHSEPKRRNAFREAYKREILFYQTIVPNFIEVQNKFNVIEGLKMKFGNCVFASARWDKEVLVLCNPQYEYTFHDRLRRLNLDHVSLVMKNFAKQHALSFALEKSQPGIFQSIKNSCCIDVQYSDTSTIPKSIISFYNASVKVVKDDIIRKKLQSCASDLWLILNRCAMPKSKEHLVICHGDCWNNNTIFKYQVRASK
jgi:hypothetical protein